MEKTSSKKAREWNAHKQWNPFNSFKLLAHVERWRKIKRGKPIPPPILITVDPTNICNLNCAWCNASFVRKERKFSLSEKALLGIADFLPRWGEGQPDIKPGVEAVCIAGGGEPLLNPATGHFIDRLHENNIEIGIVTNGVFMNRFIDSLSHCTWVGVSVDAGRSATFNQLKGLPANSDAFEAIISNISTLVDFSKRCNTRLGAKHPAYGVSFKYLLYKENIGEVFEAAKQAKEIGCKNIHYRPASTTWDKLGTDQEIRFTDQEVALFNEQIAKALELDDETFGVYGVTHKFSAQFERANFFEKCYAVFMTSVIEPPTPKSTNKDAFVLGLCCDRRGDAKLELGTDLEFPQEIQKLWGSEKHWQIYDQIVVAQDCPRCTYQPHNQIYEQVILNDSMTYKFI